MSLTSSLCYPYHWQYSSYISEGHMDRDHVPLIVNITCAVQNYKYENVQYGSVENHPGKLLAACYPNAYQMARRRVNLRCAGDTGTEWFDLHPTASEIHHVDTNEAGHIADYSKVNVFLNGFPSNRHVNEGGEVQDCSLYSDYVYIRPDNDMTTCVRMYDSLVHKYLHDNEILVPGAEFSAFSPSESSARRDIITVHFRFVFIKGVNWRPLTGSFPSNIHLNEWVYRFIPPAP